MPEQTIISDALAQATLSSWQHNLLKRRDLTVKRCQQGLDAMLDPAGLHGMDQAVNILANALANNHPIALAGDYDVDGATGVALAMDALASFGAGSLYPLLPDRFAGGYGLQPSMVETAHNLGAKMLITIDNGINAHQSVDLARQLGIEVIITDHHLPGDMSPNASAIINPNMPGCSFASKHLAGVGVIFYLMCALRTRLREDKWFLFNKLREPRLNRLLDLVALGTVADMAELDDNNRLLIKAGMARIRAGKGRKGIVALLEAMQANPAKCNTHDIGFSLAPPLNAAGRLYHMDAALACLQASSWQQARDTAAELVAHNLQRKQLQNRMFTAAMEMIAAQDKEAGQAEYEHTGQDGNAGQAEYKHTGQDGNAGQAEYGHTGQDEAAEQVGSVEPTAHIGQVGSAGQHTEQTTSQPASRSVAPTTARVLFHPDWHQGLTGLIAGMVKDKIGQSCFVLVQTDQALVGSARAAPGDALLPWLTRVNERHPGLLIRFGGHAKAAGFTLHPHTLEDFRQAINSCRPPPPHAQPEDMDDIDDGELPLDAFTLDAAQWLEDLTPWGKGCPEPLFQAELELRSYQIIGQHHLRLSFRHPVPAGVDAGNAARHTPANRPTKALGAVAFYASPQDLPPELPARVAARFHLGINRFRGHTSLQLVVKQLQLVKEVTSGA